MINDSVVKSQNLIVNHESQPIKWNSDLLDKHFRQTMQIKK